MVFGWSSRRPVSMCWPFASMAAGFRERVVELNNHRVTPAVRLNDGVNFHPTNKVVLSATILRRLPGQGPCSGRCWRRSSDFLPGFLWLVIGAVLAGAVQDFIILVASMRRNGRSLPEIAHDELGPVTGTATAVAVLFIVVVALGGVGVCRCECAVSQCLGDIYDCDDDSHRPIHGILSSKVPSGSRWRKFLCSVWCC